MTLGELRLALRARIDDTLPDYLWSDAELNSFINQATDEACIRARLNVDSTSPAVTSIVVTAGVSKYPLHKSIFYVDRVFDNGMVRELVRTSHQDLDEKFIKWPTHTAAPTHFLLDMNYYHATGEAEQTHLLTIYPIPVANSTISLTVFRLPLVAMSLDTDIPEVPAYLHADLLHWAAHLAYLKRDTDTEDLGRSTMYTDLFEKAFGAKQDARITEFRRKTRPKRVVPRWL